MAADLGRESEGSLRAVRLSVGQSVWWCAFGHAPRSASDDDPTRARFAATATLAALHYLFSTYYRLHTSHRAATPCFQHHVARPSYRLHVSGWPSAGMRCRADSTCRGPSCSCGPAWAGGLVGWWAAGARISYLRLFAYDNAPLRPHTAQTWSPGRLAARHSAPLLPCRTIPHHRDICGCGRRRVRLEQIAASESHHGASIPSTTASIQRLQRLQTSLAVSPTAILPSNRTGLVAHIITCLPSLPIIDVCLPFPSWRSTHHTMDLESLRSLREFHRRRKQMKRKCRTVLVESIDGVLLRQRGSLSVHSPSTQL